MIRYPMPPRWTFTDPADPPQTRAQVLREREAARRVLLARVAYLIALTRHLTPRPFQAKVSYYGPDYPDHPSTAYTDTRNADGTVSGVNKHTGQPVRLRWTVRDRWELIPSLCPTEADTTCWDDRLRQPVHCEHDRCHACGYLGAPRAEDG